MASSPTADLPVRRTATHFPTHPSAYGYAPDFPPTFSAHPRCGSSGPSLLASRGGHRLSSAPILSASVDGMLPCPRPGRSSLPPLARAIFAAHEEGRGVGPGVL